MKPVRRPFAGLIGIGVFLLLSFGGVAYVQTQQWFLLDSIIFKQSDYLAWGLFQLEKEHLRLRGHLQQALQYPARIDAEVLKHRYEIFVSRIDLIKQGTAAQLVRGRHEYALAIRLVDAFVANADPYLGEQGKTPLDAKALESLLIQTDVLSVPLHNLSLQGFQYLADLATQRSEVAQKQNVLGLGLAVFQAALTLGFAYIALQLLRQLQRRRKSLERLAVRLQQARRDADQANRAKSIFLANMSHELRTPFQGMLGMLSLLRQSALTPQQQDQLNTAQSSAKHLLAILNDILDMSKLESGQLDLAPEPTQPDRLIRDVEQVMRVQAQAKGLALHVRLAPDLPPWVYADGTRVKQILFNLLNNAIKFTPRGAITLTAQYAGDMDTGHTLVLTILDTGIGMDEAALAKLFTRFTQADASISRRFGGTGLGLEISRSLARLMGGDIQVRSARDVGTTVIVTLSVPPAEPLPTPHHVGPPMTDLDVQRLRVLVADDNPVNRAYLAAVLERMGVSATLCENGQEVVEALKAASFDVILMDVHMPLMDGLTTTRIIRALPPPQSGIKIIALTADALKESRVQAEQSGMDDFLAKPVYPEDLAAALKRHCGVAAAAPSPALELAAPGLHPGAETAAVPAEDLLDMAMVDSLRKFFPQNQYGSSLAMFFRDESRSIQRLLRGIDARRPEDIAREAHNLKGVAATLGLKAIAHTARGLELLATDTDDAEYERQSLLLRRQVEQSRQACFQLGLF